MEKIISKENLSHFAYVNDTICKKPIRGIVISFFGLGGAQMFSVDTREGELYAEKGILYVIPYTNPWSWMNSQTVKYTDEIVDVLIKAYDLPDDVRVVATGGSMGGQSALVYTAKAARTPVACVANCPVCDVEFHFTERPDLPRTLYSALFHEAGCLKDALESISPYHLIDKMPKVRYHIFHCTADTRVNMEAHSVKFANAMKHAGYDITFDTVADRGHCQLTLDAQRLYENYIISEALGEAL